MPTSPGGEGFDPAEGLAVKHVESFAFGGKFATALIEVVAEECDLFALVGEGEHEM